MNWIIVLFLLMAGNCFAQLKLQNLDRKKIPSSIKYKGNIINAVQWTDNSGSHIVVTTETGAVPSASQDEGSVDMALYAYHYLTIGDSIRQTWQVHDFIKDCPVDIRANFVRNSFAVTDLDQDGEAETWLMYRTVCHGDVSPSTMKIIMYEADKKYAVRGTNKVQYAEKKYLGGEYSFDEAFTKGPSVFRDYAKKLWQKHLMETWD